MTTRAKHENDERIQKDNNNENLWRNDVSIFSWHSVSSMNKSNHVWQVAKFICCRHIRCEFHINTCFDRSIHFLPRLNLFCRLNVERVLSQLVAHLVYVYTAYMNLFVHFLINVEIFLCVID